MLLFATVSAAVAVFLTVYLLYEIQRLLRGMKR